MLPPRLLPLHPPPSSTHPSLSLPYSPCYLCFLCFIFLFFSLSLSLALSFVSHTHFASPLFGSLCLVRTHILAIFSSSLTSSSSLRLLLLPLLLSRSILHHFLSKHLSPASLSPFSPFYLSLSHDLNSPHHLSYFPFTLLSSYRLALLFVLSSSLPASLIFLATSAQPLLFFSLFLSLLLNSPLSVHPFSHFLLSSNSPFLPLPSLSFCYPVHIFLLHLLLSCLMLHFFSHFHALLTSVLSQPPPLIFSPTFPSSYLHLFSVPCTSPALSSFLFFFIETRNHHMPNMRAIITIF